MRYLVLSCLSYIHIWKTRKLPKQLHPPGANPRAQMVTKDVKQLSQIG